MPARKTANRPMLADTMPCGHCGSSGHVPLPPELQATLTYLRRRQHRVTPLDVYHGLHMHGLSQSAANNRLEKLRALGYLVRTRVNGKTWAYEATS
jgi:hypothetical protein